MIESVIEFVTQLAKALQEVLASSGVEVSLTVALVLVVWILLKLIS